MFVRYLLVALGLCSQAVKEATQAEGLVRGSVTGSRSADAGVAQASALGTFGTATVTGQQPETSLFESKKLLEDLLSYRITFPHIVSASHRYRPEGYPGPQESFPQHVSVRVEVPGHLLVLELRRNTVLVSRDFKVFADNGSGAVVTESPTTQNDCHYEGSVTGFPQAYVAASICSGLSALILFTNQTFVIEPLEGHVFGGHITYRPEDLKSGAGECGVPSSSPVLSSAETLLHLHRMKRDVITETKYIELVLVADAKYMSHQRSRADAIARLLRTANTVDVYYRALGVRVVLMAVELWSTNPIVVDRDAAGTLHRFLQWRQTRLLPRLQHDHAQLLGGGTFHGGTAGTAPVHGICSVRLSGGVSLDTQSSILPVAGVLAHEIGHNLGLSHDSESPSCQCSNKRTEGCIMGASHGIRPPQAFSTCSLAEFRNLLLRGGAQCLFNLPNPDNMVGGRVCGNLFVESGEECDCGQPGSCKDPCCDASTCQLKPKAKCASVGACCESCQVLPRGRLCRQAVGECDLPEVCSGDRPDCVNNLFKKNGYRCGGGRGHCYNGQCQLADLQCQRIWGPAAQAAEFACYRFVNRAATDFGHCGTTGNSSYVKCDLQNVQCGKLQCQFDNDLPIGGGRAVIYSTSLTYQGVRYNCRGATFDNGDANNEGLVEPGTMCGEGKVCLDTKCQDVKVFGVETCNRKCNNHGVCNSEDLCHCDDGWDLPDCLHPSQGDMFTSEGFTLHSAVTRGRNTSAGTGTAESSTQQLSQAPGFPTSTSTVIVVSVCVLVLLTLALSLTVCFLVKKGLPWKHGNHVAKDSGPSATNTRNSENVILFVSETDVVHLQRSTSHGHSISSGLESPEPPTSV